MIKDGWHTIAGESVYVENGRIVRGTKNNDTLPAYVYRWDRGAGCWIKKGSISPAAFRAGIKRGTIQLT